jgi:O-antigen/teichoic acid export membrane protein
MKSAAISESHKNRALKVMAKGSILIFMGMMADHLLGYITRIFLARSLAPTEYGMLFLALSFLSIGITVSVLGLSSAVTRYVAYYHGKGDSKRVRGVVSSAFKMSVPLALVIFAIMFIFSEVLANNVFGNPALSPLIKMFSIAVVSAPFIRISISVTMSFGTAKYDVTIRALFKSIVTLVLLVVALGFGFGLMGVGFAYMIGFLSTGALAFYFMRRKVSSMLGGGKDMITMKRHLLVFSLPIIFAGFVWSVLGQTDTIMLGLLRNEVDVGLYNVILPNAQLLLVVTAAVYSFFLPTISGLFAKNGKDLIGNVYRTVARLGFYLNFPLFLIVFIFPNQLVLIFFGSEYLAGGMIGYAQSMIAVGYFVYAFSGISKSVITLYERTRLIFLNAALTLCANVVLDLLLIPYYGVFGAAVATTISMVFFSSLSLAESFLISKMHPFDINILKSVFSGVLSVTFAYALSLYLLPLTGILEFILLIAVFLIVYVSVLVFIGGLQKDDIYLLKAIGRKIGIRSGWLVSLLERFSG